MIRLEPPGDLRAEDVRAGGMRVASPTKISARNLERFLAKAKLAAGLVGCVDVLLASDARIRELNRRFRGKDKSTDVLSFPAAAVEVSIKNGSWARNSAASAVRAREKNLGDVAISYETALRQAESQGHTLEQEVRVLLLHGLLHLAGHDHESDQGRMESLEQKLRKDLGLPPGLIERGAGNLTRKSRSERSRSIATAAVTKATPLPETKLRRPGSKLALSGIKGRP